MNEIKIINKINDFWLEGDEGNRSTLSRMAENYGFYIGDKQWDASDKSELDRRGRPANTYNKILPLVNLLMGMHLNNPQDYILYPRKGGYRYVAEVLTALLKHTADISDINFAQSMQFLDGLVAIKGWVKADISYNFDPINGELIVNRVSPFDIREDPNIQEYGINSGKYIIQLFWAQKDAIINKYPKHKKFLSRYLDTVSGDDVIDFEGRTVKSREGEKDPSLYRFRLKETWWMESESRPFIVDKVNLDFYEVHPTNEEIIPIILQTEKRIAEEEKRPERYTVIERPTKVLHMATTIGDTLLEHVEDPFNGVKRFPYSRFCPYWVDGKVFSAIDNLKDVQRDYNKRRSQYLHIINQTANSGWMIDEASGVDEAKLEKVGSKPGIVIKYRNGLMPVKIQPNTVPQAHMIAAQLDKDDMAEISGINPNLQGLQESANESGVAIIRRQRQGMVQAQPIFNNFYKSIADFGETLTELIRKSDVYSPAEIMAIVEEQQQPIDPIQLMAILKSFKVGRYGVKLTTRPTSPTLRQAQLDELMQMVNAGMPIPIDVLLDYTDIAKKEEIITRIKQQQQQQQQMEYQRMMLEAQMGKGRASQPKPTGKPSPPKTQALSQSL